MDGLPAFNRLSAQLLFGQGAPALAEGRVATIQGLSARGCGSLLAFRLTNGCRAGHGVTAARRSFHCKVPSRPGPCAERCSCPPAERVTQAVYLSSPTWGNHMNIFGDERVEWRTYRYFNAATVSLDFDGVYACVFAYGPDHICAGMMADLLAAPQGSVVLLHGCAHNPTGIDPTGTQWAELAALCASRKLLPFFDVAYQGFASGDLEVDAAAPRLFTAAGLELLVAQSYSKNLGLYCERIGALSVVLADASAVQPVLGQLKRIARSMYSNPPAHGARLVAEILGDGAISDGAGSRPPQADLSITVELLASWKVELAAMAGRIQSVRRQLFDSLSALHPGHDWHFVVNQIGMFSFTGLSPAQVENMTARHKVFMTKDGRISLAGLSSAKVSHVAAALVDSILHF